MSRRWELFVLLGFLLIFSALSEAKDLYKILEVDKSASQRDIQKAFHKLSLKYHPDKNKDKNAQAKFAEINNAYEILSDEEKRKNYDTFGDEQGNQRFEGGGFGGGPGYGSSHFNFDGQNSQHFTFQQGGPQSGGGRQNFQHFTFPFEKSGGDGSYSFTYDFSGANFMEDIFSNLFGSTKSDQASWNPFGGYAGPRGGAKSSSQNPQLIVQLDSKSYREKVSDQRATWLLMFYTPSSKGYQELESILEQVANSLQGIVKVGIIDCQSQQKLCREQNAIPQKTAKLFVYSIRSNGKGSMLEYSGDWNVKDVKNYCLDLLPRFSKRIDNNDLDDLFRTPHKLPKMLLLTTKKNTPAIWRALSGIYHNRALFYDAEVPDVSSPIAKKLGVKALPAVIGILSNGDAILLSSGSGSPQNVEEIGKFIENLERRNLKVTPTQKSSESNQGAKDSISLLTRETADMLCGSHTPLCVIGVFKSAQGREKLKAILKEISHKTFTRGRRFDEVKDPVSYSLLDAAKQKSFSRAFDKSGFKDVDTVLVAYKPRKERFALYKGPFTFENTERFISEVLNGDIQFKNVLQKPGF